MLDRLHLSVKPSRVGFPPSAHLLFRSLGGLLLPGWRNGGESWQQGADKLDKQGQHQHEQKSAPRNGETTAGLEENAREAETQGIPMPGIQARQWREFSETKTGSPCFLQVHFWEGPPLIRPVFTNQKELKEKFMILCKKIKSGNSIHR